MDKLILIFWVGVKDRSSQRQHQIISRVNTYAETKLSAEHDVLFFVLPSNEHNEIKVECVNPKLISGDEYSMILDRLRMWEESVANFMLSNKKSIIEQKYESMEFNSEFPTLQMLLLYESGGDFETYAKIIGYTDFAAFQADVSDFNAKYHDRYKPLNMDGE